LKSTAVEVLFGADYFTDQLSDVTSKDASSDLRGKTAIEWSELDNLSRAESSAVKKYISRRVDDYRPAYGRRNVRVPRQCVFVGTTNKNTYLKDETGNRRFWPVTCVGEIKIDALKGDRDLLWAEAVALFEAGETWWFTSDDREASENAADEQEARRDGDPWEAVVSGALDAGEDITTDAEMNVVNVPRADENEVTTEYVLGHILGIPAAQQTRAQQSRVGAVMHALGWERRQRREGNRRVWVYVRLEPQPVTISDVSPPVTINSSCFKEDPEKSVSVLQSPSTEVGGAGGDGGDIVEKWPPNRVTTFSLAGGDGGDSVHVGAPLAAREANDPLDMV
jgi:predicted P-loop ATPase